MKTQELLVDIRPNSIDVSTSGDGFGTQEAVLSRQMRGEALISWVKERGVTSAYARIQVAEVGDMRLALELASMLAAAGHTVNVGNACLFGPAPPVRNVEKQPDEKHQRGRYDIC
jgi:hypothetical protein